MDLHSLDRKLKEYRCIHHFLDFNPSKEELLELSTLFTLSNEGHSVLRTLIKDMGTSANVDPINNLCLDDLLMDLFFVRLTYSDSTNLDQTFDQQLVEMKSGMCPQGRVIRLFQVLVAYA